MFSLSFGKKLHNIIGDYVVDKRQIFHFGHKKTLSDNRVFLRVFFQLTDKVITH